MRRLLQQSILFSFAGDGVAINFHFHAAADFHTVKLLANAGHTAFETGSQHHFIADFQRSCGCDFLKFFTVFGFDFTVKFFRDGNVGFRRLSNEESNKSDDAM